MKWCDVLIRNDRGLSLQSGANDVFTGSRDNSLCNDNRIGPIRQVDMNFVHAARVRQFSRAVKKEYPLRDEEMLFILSMRNRTIDR